MQRTSPTSRSFTADAANSKELSVTATVSWTAKSSASWLTVKTASGSGNGKIVYNVAANSGTSSRTATITVSGGGKTATFTVTQSGKAGGVQLWKNGPYWAETNIGADNPEDAGLYFWWGDTVGYKRKNGAWVASDGSVTDFEFAAENTPTYDKDDATLKSTGWITSEGVLAPGHDAARAHWGGTWRMPTIGELKELEDGCEWRFCRNKDRLEYYKVISKVNGAMILIPLAGLWLDERFLERSGSLWSSSLQKSDPLPGQEGFIGDNVWFSSFRPDDLRYAVCLDFGYSDTLECDMIGRQSFFKSYGLPVRAVTE